MGVHAMAGPIRRRETLGEDTMVWVGGSWQCARSPRAHRRGAMPPHSLRQVVASRWCLVMMALGGCTGTGGAPLAVGTHMTWYTWVHMVVNGRVASPDTTAFSALESAWSRRAASKGMLLPRGVCVPQVVRCLERSVAIGIPVEWTGPSSDAQARALWSGREAAARERGRCSSRLGRARALDALR